MVSYRAAMQGMLTGVMLAVARITGETAPLLFTALNNQFWSTDLNAPMANLPVVIFQFAMSPYDDWQTLAWGGALLITVAILFLNIGARLLASLEQLQAMSRLFRLPRRRRRSAARCREPHSTTPRVRPSPARRCEIRNVKFFYYGASQALKDINLSLHDKRVTAFIGPSGCGKSTLLRILNRIYELYPDQRATGEVLVDGENILDAGPRPQPAARQDRHGVPEADAVPDVDLRQHRLRHPALRKTAARASWTSASSRRCAAPPCGTRSRTSCSQSGLGLSGGQQQRLCIARAIAVKPEILLLDEPASALDPISTQRIEELIAELKSDYCIVIVTHNMQQAARSSDYTAFMYLGELIEFDETETIFTHPKQRQTEDYITGRFG